MALHLDVNFNFKTDGYIKVARVCEPFNLGWLEIDTYDAEGLRLIRDRPGCRLPPVSRCSGAGNTGPSSRTARSMWRS